jgi:hypothetical protein
MDLDKRACFHRLACLSKQAPEFLLAVVGTTKWRLVLGAPKVIESQFEERLDILIEVRPICRADEVIRPSINDW